MVGLLQEQGLLGPCCWKLLQLRPAGGVHAAPPQSELSAALHLTPGTPCAWLPPLLSAQARVQGRRAMLKAHAKGDRHE